MPVAVLAAWKKFRQPNLEEAPFHDKIKGLKAIKKIKVFSEMTFREIQKILFNNTPRKIFYMARWKLSRKRPAQQFNDRRPCVFVLSTGRVGSETLSALLGLAKNVYVYHEPRPELFSLSKLAYELSGEYPANSSLAAALQEGFMTARRQILTDALYCDRGYVETGPQATFLAPLMLKAIPDIRFIHLIRDPRKVVISAMRRGWYGGHAYDVSRIVPRTDSPFHSAWDAMDTYQKNLWLWAETNRWILDYSKSLTAKQYLLVHAEDIFNANIGVIDNLFNFIETTAPTAYRISRVLGRKLNAQTQGVFKLPADWLAGADAQLSAFVSQTAAALGYAAS